MMPYRILVAAIAAAVILGGCAKETGKGTSGGGDEKMRIAARQVEEPEETQAKNSYESLSVPTQVNKVGDTWFIVDCYHDQVIYYDNMDDPLTQWNVMTGDIDKGHTVASDGVVYLVDDTEGERILVFERGETGFVNTQVFDGITARPHCIIYDEETKTFYAWASTGGKMYLIQRDEHDGQMYITDEKYIEKLDGVYVRSFTIMGDEIYFPSAQGSIICADRESFEIKKEYKVPDSMAGMVQVIKIGDYFYITVSTDLVGFQDFATIVRCSDLSELEEGKYEDVYDEFIGGGTPYYISKIGDEYYLTEHRLPGHSIWRFTESGGNIDATTLY